MRTAISIPDDIFYRAHEYARERGMTRSALFAAAVEQYIGSRRAGEVTKALNRVYSQQPSSLDPVLGELQRLTIPESW